MCRCVPCAFWISLLSDIRADVLLVRFGSWCRYVACVQTGHGNSEDVVDSSSDVVNFFGQA